MFHINNNKNMKKIQETKKFINTNQEKDIDQNINKQKKTEKQFFEPSFMQSLNSNKKIQKTRGH